MNVALSSAVFGSFGVGSRAAVLTAEMAPDSRSALSPKPLLAMTFRKPPGHRRPLPVSTSSVYSVLP